MFCELKVKHVLTDYFRYYKFNNTSAPFREEKKKHQKLKIVRSRFWVIYILVFIKFKCKNIYIFIFYTFIPKKNSTYYSGSALTQYYYARRVSTVLNRIVPVKV